jgi:GNAT superfamily N-acetyltransferase
MQSIQNCRYRIRKIRPGEFSKLGQLTVDVYASLPGMPKVDEQRDYYEMLRDVAKRAGNSAISVFAAVSDSGELLGSVDFIDDMKQYRSGGTASTVSDAAGIRLLAVAPECRGKGIGKALTQFCIEQARGLGKSKVILHSTKAMETAWMMYERMGFERFSEIDFQQGNLDVFGFRLNLETGLNKIDPA